MHQGSKVDERREFQRLSLDTPLDATFQSAPVKLIEAGILGARVQHTEPLSGTRGELRFTFDGADVAMRCEVVRTFQEDLLDKGSALISALRFVAAIGESGDQLRHMLASMITHEIENKHDSSGTRLRLRAVDGDKTVRGADAQFHCYRFENGAWRRRPVFLPEQPPLGFTVARSEDADEMQRLCTVYEASDDEGRRLIRMFAELSVSDVLQIPPRS
jgi:hypothetical protein